MKILFINFTDYKISKVFFDKVLSTIVKEEKIKEDFDIEVALMGEGRMRTINKRYAGKNKVADVLTFPLSEIKKSSKKELQFIDLEQEDAVIGQILLCPSRIKKQAKRFKKDFKDQLAFMFLHGFLHLLGYNHKGTQDTKKMRKREKEILNVIIK
jgi:probable rRNA maturation factor